MTGPTLVALDLFAGTGWGVACRRLGIIEHGVENMPAALATRAANGMRTAYTDVWDGLEDHGLVPAHTLQIASPPCQSFSMAGKGAGRAALDAVLRLLKDGVYKRPADLRNLTRAEGFDDRTALVLTPLAYAYQWRPTFIAWEQVPAVLPVWEAAADELRAIGYSVAVGTLHAEQYGVPQTRTRAILVARNDGQEAPLPAPTHSRYHSRTPDRLDPGVHKWVSMAEALGWGMNVRPYPTLSTGAGTAGGGTDPAALGGSGARRTVYRERAEGRWDPSGTDNDDPDGILRLTADEAAALQTYPTAAPPYGDATVYRNGNQAHAAVRPLDAPAPTVHFGARANKVEWMDADQAGDTTASGQRVTVEEAAALQTYPVAAVPGDTSWVHRRPSPTIVGSYRPDIVAAPGWRKPGDPPRQKTPGSVLIDLDQAATIQSYEPAFVFKGTKTQQFLQIGNAVPPLLAEHVLAAITADQHTPTVPADVAPTSHDDELPIFDLEGATP